MNGKRRGYAVVMVGGNVYQDRMGRHEFPYWRCLVRTMWPRHACHGGTIHRMPFRGKIPGYIPPWVPKESWKS